MMGSVGATASRRLLLKQIAATTAYFMASRSYSRASTEELRFGLTPVFLTSDLELLGRLQLYLSRATGLPVTLLTRRTYQEIVALLISRQIDAAWICGYPYVMHEGELQLVAIPEWRGRPLYQSYLIIDADRQGDGLGDLRGDTHAFSDPDSNSGFLVTRAALAEMRETPERFFARTFFTYGHRNVIRAVASGLATSGSVDGYVYEVVAAIEPALTARTRIMWRSEWLGFPPIAAPRNPVDPGRLALLSKALLNMSDDEDGRAVLAMLRLDGFVTRGAELFSPIAAKAALVASAG
ncbi:PhnD/SsuA/transferrin family substrate-binding protein [Bosea sp. 117]|uniref:substrate-binding domain-containing protein n=1 Tax=Bosea sp. 117 TaxID=1125973 RepID=UPI000493C318|nr:PhnD/SsuA/transferrin family substrate-binding protein [Bosea sp. 117]